MDDFDPPSSPDGQSPSENEGEHQPIVAKNLDIYRPEPINEMAFPDVTSEGKPAKTMRNVEVMLAHYGVVSRYDVIKKTHEFLIPGFSSCSDTASNTAITVLVNLGTLNGLYSGTFERYLYAIASANPFNSVLDWIKSNEWDGEDRIQSLCDTLVVDDGFDNELKETMLRLFLIGAVKVLVSDEPVSFRGVPTLQGYQALGKTRWVSRLISDPLLAEKVIKLDHHLDASNKDSIISAVKNWIVEIGELDSSFRKDVARLKGFISNKSDHVRLPYDRRQSEYQRRTVFIATVNSPNFLVDETGNSRWWLIPCVKINHEHDIDMQQVWAQVLDIVQTTEDLRWWLDDDELQRLESFNNQHRVLNAVVDRLETQLDMDAQQNFWSNKTATEVLQLVGLERPSNSQCREAGSFLRERMGPPKKINGSMKWRVPPRKREFVEGIHQRKSEPFDNTEDF